jgi:superfamily II DNA/RNA helicase
VIIGGVSVGEQTCALREGIDIIVATPGRLEELINSGEIDLAHMRFFILDEAVNKNNIYLFYKNFFCL